MVGHPFPRKNYDGGRKYSKTVCLKNQTISYKTVGKVCEFDFEGLMYTGLKFVEAKLRRHGKTCTNLYYIYGDNRT